MSLKGQAGTGGSSLPLSLMQNAVTARADTAENLCSLGSLVSFGRSFWHLVGTLIHREGQTGQPGQKKKKKNRLPNPAVVDFRAAVHCSNRRSPNPV